MYQRCLCPIVERREAGAQHVSERTRGKLEQKEGVISSQTLSLSLLLFCTPSRRCKSPSSSSLICAFTAPVCGGRSDEKFFLTHALPAATRPPTFCSLPFPLAESRPVSELGATIWLDGPLADDRKLLLPRPPLWTLSCVPTCFLTPAPLCPLTLPHALTVFEHSHRPCLPLSVPPPAPASACVSLLVYSWPPSVGQNRQVTAPPCANTSSVHRTQAFSTSPVAKRDIAKMTLVGRLGAMETKEGKNGRQYLKYAIATTDRRPPPREGGECSFFLFQISERERETSGQPAGGVGD